MTYHAADDRYDSMTYRFCGRSGLQLPLLSLGLWQNFGDDKPHEVQRTIVRRAFDRGVTHFDLANNYGPPYGQAEINFGQMLRQDLAPYRDELIISTKAGYLMWPGPYGDWGSRKHIIAGLDQSLRRLGLDYVDIFYHHRMDPNTPLEETINTLCDIVKQGKALYIGLSNYDGPTMERAALLLDKRHCPFVIAQNRYNILDRMIERNGLKSACVKKERGLIAFSPLAQGLLSERYLHGIPEDSRVRTDGRFLHAEQLTDKRLAQMSCLNAIAAQRGQSLAQMALSWVLRDDVVTSVLVGASKPEQIRENAAMANQSHHFSDEELRNIDQICEVPLD